MTQSSLKSSEVKQCQICLQAWPSDDLISSCQFRGPIQYEHLACLQSYFNIASKMLNQINENQCKNALKVSFADLQQMVQKYSHLSNVSIVNSSPISQIAKIFSFWQYIQYFYIGFHVIEILLILQESVVSRIVGGFCLITTRAAFNYALYRIAKELCFVLKAQVKSISFACANYK